MYKIEDNLVAPSLFKGLQCKQDVRKHTILPSQKKVWETFTLEVPYSTTLLAVAAHLQHYFIHFQNVC